MIGQRGVIGLRGVSRIGSRDFAWGERTYVMGIVNVTPDSFSGDGLLTSPSGRGAGAPTTAELAVAHARAMVEEGADVLDVGGESSRPGHQEVAEADEVERVVPVVAAIRAALPSIPISVDTTKATVARAALDAGANLINDVWAVAPRTDLVDLAADRQVPIVLMHNRAEPRVTQTAQNINITLRGAKARLRREQRGLVPGGVGERFGQRHRGNRRRGGSRGAGRGNAERAAGQKTH